MLDWSKVRGLARESPWSTRLGAGHEANHPALGPYVQHDTKRTTEEDYFSRTYHDHTTEINNPQRTHSLFIERFPEHTSYCFLFSELYFAAAVQRAENIKISPVHKISYLGID